LQAHVAAIHVGDGKQPPQVIESQPFQTEIWSFAEEPLGRVTAGEYLAVTFLRAGGLGVVTPIQNEREKRFGFKWWKFVER